MTNPYEWLPIRLQVIACIVLIMLTILWGKYAMTQGAPLQAKLPHGVVDMEIPWSTANAERLLALLGADGRAVLRTNVMLDYLFLILYPLAISTACALVAYSLGGRTELYGAIIAWAVLAAMPLDATENAAMLMMLSDHTAAPWPQLSTICSTIKFGVVIGGLGFVGFGTCAKVVITIIKSIFG